MLHGLGAELLLDPGNVFQGTRQINIGSEYSGMEIAHYSSRTP